MSTISSMTPGSILYACGISIVCSVTLMSVAMGTVHWLEIDRELGYSNMECGLFKCCSGGNCIDLDEMDGLTDYDLDSIHETTGLCSGAFLCYVIALAIMAHLVFVRKLEVQSRTHGRATLAVSICGTVFVIAGSSNFVAKANDSSSALHYEPGWNIDYSFFLASATGVISILTGVLAFLGSNRLLRNQQSQHMVFQQPPNPHPGLGVHAGTHPYNPMVNPHQAGMMAPPPPPLPPPQGYGTNQPNMAVQGNQYPQYEHGTK